MLTKRYAQLLLQALDLAVDQVQTFEKQLQNVSLHRV
jgi:hypothetical protein